MALSKERVDGSESVVDGRLDELEFLNGDQGGGFGDGGCSLGCRTCGDTSVKNSSEVSQRDGDRSGCHAKRG